MRHLTFLRLTFAALAALLAPSIAGAEKLTVWIGTYGKGPGQGIFRAELDTRAGTLSDPVNAAEETNPSFVAVHPSGKYLYSVSEVADAGGKRGGGVAAFAIGEGRSLKLLGRRSSGGSGPCHVTVNPAGDVLLVANYGGGTVASLPIGTDGSLGEPGSVIQHEGSGPNKARQERPHAHSINPDAAGRFAVSADLGIDKLLIYRLDGAKLTPNDPPFASTPPGGGPRHFAFHPSGKWAFTNNEMTCTVTSFAWDAEKGSLTPVEDGTVTTLPRPVGPGDSTAEVVAHPNGKFVYVSNRGHDTIASFSVDAASGRLKPIGHTPCGGRIPRNFALDPSGAWCIAAHQDSDSLALFRVDLETGELSDTKVRVKAPKPVCVRFQK
jgi:6-phosphogluconolactonase